MSKLPPDREQLNPIGPAILRKLSGIEVFESMMAGELPLPPICGVVPMILSEVEPGRIVWKTKPSVQLLNPLGTVHGGYAMTVLDSCLGCAVHSALPAGRGYSTVEVKTNLVRRIEPDGGPFWAEGKTLHVGRRVATAEGKLVDRTGNLVAFGTTTCLVFDA